MVGCGAGLAALLILILDRGHDRPAPQPGDRTGVLAGPPWARDRLGPD